MSIPVVTRDLLRQAREVRDLHTQQSPKSLRIMQVTTDPAHTHSHIYMESPVWTPDSRRFVYRRMWIPEIAMRYWREEFWVCDIDDGFALWRLTDEPCVTAPAVDPTGKYLYYFINNLEPASRKGIRLMRVEIETLKREVVMVLDKPLGDWPAPPSLVYPLGAIRSDGRTVAAGVFLGDGGKAPPIWGVMVCDIQRNEARIIFANKDLVNTHQQYCRSTDPRFSRDLLIQENFAVQCDAGGRMLSAKSGCLLYVIKDDGTNFRYVPCGGDRVEYCHGHQEWRGSMPTVIVGVDCPGGVPGSAPSDQLDALATKADWTTNMSHWVRPVIEAWPIAAPSGSCPLPRQMPGAAFARNDITRAIEKPAFGHTTFDLSGTRFVGDWRAPGMDPLDTRMYLGELPAAPGATLAIRYLFHPRSHYTSCQSTHPHPCLSPDGKRLLFNTDFAGQQQIWYADGF